ncbi:hypothetical protein [Lysinibacillus sp. NPDC093692]|uniref:hypothetical protein n=1 Tax=Lysinibacillus sp. NPDC093692 TaxID=3390578 RepID=UPI003D0742B5
MSWTHIVLEGYCSFEENEGEEIPKCCSEKPGILGYHCLQDAVSKNNICPYFSFNSARSTLVLTDKNGKAIEFDSFFGDLDLSEKDWLVQEERWIKKWRKTIKKEKE